MILPCICSHKFQDKTYGPSNRVHNYALKGYQGKRGWRCTVCGDVKPMQEMPRQEGKSDD